ncbi:MAG: helix-turn-helix domain-containing protein [Candidatus Bathyarchaeia archaeon]
MPDVLLVLLSILLATTIIAAVEYYRQLRRAQKEYEKARDAVEDIVLSFNRQFKHEADKLEALGYKIEAAASRTDGAVRKAEELDGMMRALESRIATDSEDRRSMSMHLADLERKASDSVASQGTIASKIASLEEQANQFRLAPETHFEGVIPLKREKAMAQLTDTEVSVLELLVSEGAKTAPEIKERVKLSREHTARLMKKLYEEGYLERETGKIPFKYTVKKEMEKLLKKTESEAT